MGRHQYPHNSIVLFRLISSELIIARVHRAPPHGDPSLVKARALIPVPGGQPGSFNVQFVPVGMPFFDDKDCAEMPPFDDGIILQSKVADKAMADAYVRAVSGIHMSGPTGAGMVIPR